MFFFNDRCKERGIYTLCPLFDLPLGTRSSSNLVNNLPLNDESKTQKSFFFTKWVKFQDIHIC